MHVTKNKTLTFSGGKLMMKMELINIGITYFYVKYEYLRQETKPAPFSLTMD